MGGGGGGAGGSGLPGFRKKLATAKLFSKGTETVNLVWHSTQHNRHGVLRIPGKSTKQAEIVQRRAPVLQISLNIQNMIPKLLVALHSKICRACSSPWPSYEKYSCASKVSRPGVAFRSSWLVLKSAKITLSVGQLR